MEKEIKAIGLMLILIITGIILWDILGFDSGRGGNPQESYQEDYYEND